MPSQALFKAGACSLVVSLRKVDDTATSLLMVRFYENLLGGRGGLKTPMAKAEALAEAKRWLRNLTAKEAETLAKNLPPMELGSRLIRFGAGLRQKNCLDYFAQFLPCSGERVPDGTTGAKLSRPGSFGMSQGLLPLSMLHGGERLRGRRLGLVCLPLNIG
jgi:CHAT domain-containing protein